VELKTQYWDRPDEKTAFKEFMIQIFGLDFDRWDKAGFWDPSYTPFSYFEQGRVISSVCGYILDATIGGKKTSMLQFSGVGTLPEWRRKGLNRKLTEKVLKWAVGRQEGIFLFSSDVAIPFYKSCGFRPVTEYIEFIEAAPVPSEKGLRKLDANRDEDLDRIHEYAVSRAPISNEFSIMSPNLLMFHVLYGLGDGVFEIPDLECIVLLHRSDGHLKIFDVVGKRIPEFSELYPYISENGDEIIEFHFLTDKLNLCGSKRKKVEGNNPFVMGEFPLENPVFPFTSRA
jgi:GNAT superfamily N-acetyltransferase